MRRRKLQVLAGGLLDLKSTICCAHLPPWRGVIGRCWRPRDTPSSLPLGKAGHVAQELFDNENRCRSSLHQPCSLRRRRWRAGRFDQTTRRYNRAIAKRVQGLGSPPPRQRRDLGGAGGPCRVRAPPSTGKQSTAAFRDLRCSSSAERGRRSSAVIGQLAEPCGPVVATQPPPAND